jgi:V/A-type H+/Na+-transporting ATPase subunit F
MSSYRIAIVGPREAVAGFALLGVDVVAATHADEAIAHLYRLKKAMRIEDGRERNVYGVIFVAEDLLQQLSPDDERRLSRGALPAIVPLPSHRGATGYGLLRLKRIVERAVGSDILA